MVVSTAAVGSQTTFGARLRQSPRARVQAAVAATPETETTSVAAPVLFVILTGLALVASAADRTLAAPIVGLTVILMMVVALVSPRVALFVVFGLSIFFESGNGDPLQAAGEYFQRDIQGAFGVPSIQFTGMEVIQLLALLGTLIGTAARGKKLQAGEMKTQAWFFLILLLAGFVRGVAGGGLINFAVWEGRFMIAMMVCFFIAANAIRNRAHVRELITVLFLACSASAIEGAWRRIALIDTGQMGDMQEWWYGHDNVVFWGAFIVLVIVQQAFGAPRWQRLLGPALAVLTMYTMMVSERRSGYVSLIAAFLVVTLVFLVTHRKAFFLICVPLIVVSALYVPAFWNATGPIAQPARALRSISDPDPRDAASNLARDLEKINIRFTIASDPLLGVGFGRPYILVAPIPDISWWALWQYATHAQIMWIWLKTGAIGFIAFWILMGSGLSRAAFNARFLQDRDLRVFSILCMVGIVTALGFSYVDIGLVGGRVPCFLGTLLGALSVVSRLDIRPQSATGVQPA
jgi:hypothetical protein